jgi:hypothetical protein
MSPFQDSQDTIIGALPGSGSPLGFFVSRSPKYLHISHRLICVEFRAIYTRFQRLFLAIPDPQTWIHRENAAMSASRVVSFLLGHIVLSSIHRETAACKRRRKAGGATRSSPRDDRTRRPGGPTKAAEMLVGGGLIWLCNVSGTEERKRPCMPREHPGSGLADKPREWQNMGTFR